MAGVPFIFGNATTSIPLSNLDANFNTGVTIGNTTVGLGNTVTTLGNVTLTNVNIVSGTVPVPTSIANGTSNVSISSSGGNINVVTGGTIATFPQSTGTVMVSGNMPAFSAYLSANQSISTGVYTKVQFNIKEFDTNSNYDNATNYRFTPTVAGYYQVNSTVDVSGSIATTFQTLAIYKNGSSFKSGNLTTNSGGRITVSALIYLNGSTDYIEVYGYITGTSPAFGGGSGITYFQASMVRGA